VPRRIRRRAAGLPELLGCGETSTRARKRTLQIALKRGVSTGRRGGRDDRRQLTRLGRDLPAMSSMWRSSILRPDVRPYHLHAGRRRPLPPQIAAPTLLHARAPGRNRDARGRRSARPRPIETRPGRLIPTAAALRTLDYYAARGRRIVNADLRHCMRRIDPPYARRGRTTLR